MANEIIKLNTQEAVETANKVVEEIAENSRVVVNSQPTFEIAKERLGEIKKIRNSVVEKKESITKPLNEALKNVRGLFKPIEDKLDVIEDYLKNGVLKYNQKLLDEQKKREDDARKQIEEAEKNGEKEIDVEKITKPVERIAQKVEAIKTRKIKELRIVDEQKIPREFLTPNTMKIKDALLSGIKVAGCEIIEKEIAVNNY